MGRHHRQRTEQDAQIRGAVWAGLTTWNEQTRRTIVTRTTRKHAAQAGTRGWTRHSARTRVGACTKGVLSAFARWTDACSKMQYPGSSEKIYWRDCYACGKPMTLIKDYMVTLECVDCDIRENGTVNGRFQYELDEYVEWNDMLIKTIDHSKVHLPSPDMIGNDEPVQVAEQTLQRETAEENR